MKKLLGMAIIAASLMVAVSSCSDEPKVIPVQKMEKIYKEMFLADQWLVDFPAKRSMADTTWFYEPIFEKYGYDVEDYRKSVDYYLNDPKRYADMMDRIVRDMEDEIVRIDKDIEKQDAIRHKADSIASVLGVFAPKDLTLYKDIFQVNSMTDRVELKLSPRGVYVPVPVVEDTVFHGPELVIRDSTFVPEPEPAQKPIPCLE